MGGKGRLGLLGYHISYSHSPEIYHSIWRKEGVEGSYSYEIVDLSPEELTLFLGKVRQQKGEWLGFNVTIPYKEVVIGHLDALSPEAEAIGAVNCVKVLQCGSEVKLLGYNTDAIGFCRSLKPWAGLRGKKALILGTGGAAKAVSYALREWLSMEVWLASRGNEVKAQRQLKYKSISDELFASFHLVVNATPLGSQQYPNEAPPLPYHFAHNGQLFYDLVYNPPTTPFMQKGLEKGANVTNGEVMLLEQAIAAWLIFTDEQWRDEGQ